MAVPDLLRELVERQGRAVFDDADHFRALLDDVLAEDDASRGEINLLVDAVRLGAARRLLSLLDHGADAEAAVEEVAVELARDRGADSASGARWALGVIAHACGRAGVEQIGTVGAPPARPASPQLPPAAERAPEPAPEPAPGPTPGPAPGPAPGAAPERPTAPPTEAVDLGGAHTRSDEPAGATLSATRSPRSRRRPVVLAGCVVGIVAVAAVVSLVSGRGPLGDVLADDGPGPTAPGGGSGAPDGTALSPDELLVSVSAGGGSRLYRVDVTTGKASRLVAPERDDAGGAQPGLEGLATISPDRSTIVFLRKAADADARVPMRLDVATGEVTPFLADGGPCAYSARPAFSPDGTKVAVPCIDEHARPTGSYLFTPDGTVLSALHPEGELTGTFSWFSDGRLVYPASLDGGPSRLQVYDPVADVTEPLTSGPEAADKHPDYSAEAGPAGLVVFTRGAPTGTGGGELWTIDADGVAGRIDVAGPVAHPTWSPDGTRIAYIDETSGHDVLAVVALEDPSDVRTYDLPGDPGAPAWSTR